MAIQSLSPEEVYKYLHTSPAGLEEHEASDRLKHFGPNEIIETAKSSLLYTLIKHITNLFALLLWGATIIAFIGEAVKPGEGFLILGFAIMGVIFINGGFAFFQEYRAEKAFEALKKLLPFMVTVVREGNEKEVNASDVVPGDIVLLKEGDRVPADIRLIKSAEIKVDNSSINGESNPAKRTASPQNNTELFDSINLVFAGTSVVTGQGKGVAFATGMSTEFGKIARLTSEVKSGMSPLELETMRVTRTISIIAVFLGILFFVTGIFIGRNFTENFIFALGIVVGMVPEGLIPTVTLSLALASQRLAKKKALIRTLTSVETLGSVTVICTDKTGTLTQNKMAVVEIYMNGQRFIPPPLLGGGQGEGELRRFSDEKFLKAISLCNDAHIRDGVIIGDPTEKALLEFAQNYLDMNTLKSEEPRIAEQPFDSFNKWMATFHKKDNRKMIYVKGAPENVLQLCSNVLIDSKVIQFDDSKKKEAEQALNDMTAKALRVLAVAYREVEGNPPLEKGGEGGFDAIANLTFLGLAALEDPPRPEVPEAIKGCKSAGIKIIMVTGDNPETARAVGREIGLFRDPVVTTGHDLKGKSHKELMHLLKEKELVFARVTPEDKMTIVSALKDLGEVVAVTGDGVNDAPALKKADIGVAMGLSGTDVAKEASDIILMDDNFATIVKAIEEGRTVFENIKKFTTYVLTHTIPEIIPFIGYVIFDIPLPLTIFQILAIDLGTDIIPALALGTEPPEPDILKRPPRSVKERLLSFPLLARAYLFLGPIEALASMAGFFWFLSINGWKWGTHLPANNPLYLKATTVCLTGIIVTQIANVFVCRSGRNSVFSISIKSNKLILLGIVTELVLLTLIVYTTPGNIIAGTSSIPLSAWLFFIPFSLLLLGMEEIRKLIMRKRLTKM
ncbi:MAG: cation-transporting P-type ATPase [Nitrospira sp.]|nr:cation-transporting P-type ATPase [Nitrospira sp.]